MRIRMKIPVSGTFHNLTDGVRVGDIVEVDDDSGASYVKLGYAEEVEQPREERAVAPKTETATKPTVEPEKPKPQRTPKA